MNIYEQFKEFLKKEDMIFIEQFGKYPLVTMKIQGSNGLLFITIHYSESKKSLVCFSDFPIVIPREKRNKIYEFISVINSQSLISNFILDCDGYLRVKSSLFSCETEITAETFRKFLFTNFNSLETHFKKILVLSEINYSQSAQTQINFN